MITLNANGLNTPIKRHRVSDWIKKQDPSICCLQEPNFRVKYTQRLKVRGWKKLLLAIRNDKKVGVAILISDKIDFKTKPITKGKEGHYIMIKGSIQKEDIILVNTYISSTGTPKYIKQILTHIKREMDNNTTIVEEFNTPLTSVDTSSRQKINKATGVLNDIIASWI